MVQFQVTSSTLIWFDHHVSLWPTQSGHQSSRFMQSSSCFHKVHKASQSYYKTVSLDCITLEVGIQCVVVFEWQQAALTKNDFIKWWIPSCLVVILCFLLLDWVIKSQFKFPCDPEAGFCNLGTFPITLASVTILYTICINVGYFPVLSKST